MKKLLLVLGLVSMQLHADAHHIIGGVMYYTDAGPDGSNNHKYIVHLRLYRGCEPVDNQHSDLDPMITFTIYDKGTGEIYGNPIPVNLASRQYVNSQYTDPCIINPSPVCYQVGHYDATVSVPANADGYIVVFQRCCRNNLLDNVNAPDVGATYYTELPGTSTGIIGDNSPYFPKEEAVLICANSRFSYDYSAVDPDKDSLSYSFIPALTGGAAGEVAPAQADPPPYYPLTYVSPYSAAFPMGSQVKIDPITGIISGIAPSTGTYVICIRVNEYRNHKLIGYIFKDYHIDVTNCHREATASIPDNFLRCQSMTINFTDNSTTGHEYLWDFGDGDTSNLYAPTHTYRDTGTYVVTLLVDPGKTCGDSTSTIAKVYPVLHPDFSMAGNCTTQPTLFQDKTTSTSGPIDYWHWDFGNGDTTDIENPTYQYNTPNVYNVMLTTSNSKGCLSTDTQQLRIYNAPPIGLVNDTDLCFRDSIQLTAQTITGGNFTWSPSYHILNSNSATPTFFPRSDTTYFVTFTDPTGCTNTDSVRINVKTVLQLKAAADTTICTGDPVSLSASADGRYVFRWTDQTNNNIVAYQEDTLISPPQNTQYKITAILQSCTAEDSMNVRLVNYPRPQPLSVYSICYNDTVAIHASGGAYYSWIPSNTLNHSTAQNPTAHPLDTTLYIAAVTDTLGCPKPTYDSAIVMVIPPVKAFAGNDTIITKGQVFQLHATTNTPGSFSWYPPTGLSDPAIADPVVNNNQDISYYLTVQTPQNCIGKDTINIRYIKGPFIYVPTAFTPNNDGQNDLLTPIPVGIVNYKFFRVYNRWGQLMFQSQTYLQGWDGTYKGRAAAPGTYVWEVEGVDYTGRTIFRKGTAVLIR